MEEVPLRILNHKVCIICCCECETHDDTEKMTLFTETVIKQFLTSTQAICLVGSRIFDFCISCCTGILEDLVHLQTSLDFILESIQQNLEDNLQTSLEYILQNIKQKKLEMKIKILNSSSGIHDKDSDAFRKFATRDFRPRIQIKKCDIVEVLPLLPSFENESHHCANVDVYNSPQSGICTADVGCNSEKTNLTEMVIFESDENSSLELQYFKMNSLYDNEKIRSEEILIQPGMSMPFVEQETVVKFEPWHDLCVENESIDEFIEYTDESVRDLKDTENNNSKNKTEIGSADEKNIKNFRLTVYQLSVLAIITSENMQMSVQEITGFIMDNFPHFKRKVLQKRISDVFRHRQRSYLIRKNKTRCYSIYKIIQNDDLLRDLEIINQKLDRYLVSFMAFPERLLAFKKVISNKISHEDGKDLNFQQQNEFPEGVTNFGEMYNCVETSENVVKIEHCVYAMDTEDSFSENTSHIEEQWQEHETLIINPAQLYQIMDDSKTIVDQDIKYDKKSLLPLKSQQDWPEPSLSYKQMCILAIVNSSSFFATVTDVQQFITENFPFYANDVLKLKAEIQGVLSLPTFTALNCQEKEVVDDGQWPQQINLDNTYSSMEIVSLPTFTSLQCQDDFGDGQISQHDSWENVYTIEKEAQEGTMVWYLRQKIAKSLSLNENIKSMAYPERISTFIKNVMPSELNILPQAKLIPKETQARKGHSKRPSSKITSERQRRTNQRISFINLRKLVPDIKTYIKCSKVKILKQAKQYIQKLESFEKELIQRKLDFKNENSLLLAEYSDLVKMNPE